MNALGTVALLALAAGGAALGLSRLARASGGAWSDADYQRRRRSPGEGLLAAAMKAIGDELGPGGKVAAEARREVEESGAEAQGGKEDSLLLRLAAGMTDRATTSAQPSDDDELRRRHLQVYGHLAHKLLAVHEAEPRLLTGRQPLTELDARELAGRGVTHVLDLREEREWNAPGRHGAEALAELAALGVERLALPIPDGEAPDPATLDLAVEFLERATGPDGSDGSTARAYVHCRAGIERTGTVMLAFRAWRDALPVDRVLDAITGPESPYSPLPWQVDAVRRWLAARRGHAPRLES